MLFTAIFSFWSPFTMRGVFFSRCALLKYHLVYIYSNDVSTWSYIINFLYYYDVQRASNRMIDATYQVLCQRVLVVISIYSIALLGDNWRSGYTHMLLFTTKLSFFFAQLCMEKVIKVTGYWLMYCTSKELLQGLESGHLLLGSVEALYDETSLHWMLI